MTAADAIVQQISEAYERMAREARYRPAAPSDGFGNIGMPEAELDLQQEMRVYAERWWQEEETDSYWLGNPDYSDRPALIHILEAARTLNGGNLEVSAKLLRMALNEIEGKG